MNFLTYSFIYTVYLHNKIQTFDYISLNTH